MRTTIRSIEGGAWEYELGEHRYSEAQLASGIQALALGERDKDRLAAKIAEAQDSLAEDILRGLVAEDAEASFVF